MSDNPHKKSITLALIIIFGSLLILFIFGLISRNQAANDLYEAEREIFLEWFGDDDRLHQYMQIWEESGLVGLGIINQVQYDAIVYSFTSRDFADLTEISQRDVEALLTGGFPLIDENETGDEFNARRFNAAIQNIESILRLSRGTEGFEGMEAVDIRWDWYDLVGNER